MKRVKQKQLYQNVITRNTTLRSGNNLHMKLAPTNINISDLIFAKFKSEITEEIQPMPMVKKKKCRDSIGLLGLDSLLTA